MSGYVAIAGILLYLFLLQTLDSAKMNPLKAAIFWVIGYYALFSVVFWIEYSARGFLVLPNLLNPTRIITAILQFAAVMGIFYKADETGDSYMSYLGWGVAGLVLIFYLVPIISQMLFFLL